MRKIVAAFVGLFAVMVFLTPATADVSSEAPAIVINDFGCGMLDGDGGFIFVTNSHAVITSSGNGNLRCQASGVANSSGRAVRWNNANTGLLCGIFFTATDRWNNVVSQSGQATLSCHAN